MCAIDVGNFAHIYTETPRPHRHLFRRSSAGIRQPSTQHFSFAWARVLAVASVIAMFFYFAGFFRIVDRFHEQWYRSGLMLDAVGLLISAFAMIPVLSVFSSRMKCGGRRWARVIGPSLPGLTMIRRDPRCQVWTLPRVRKPYGTIFNCPRSSNRRPTCTAERITLGMGAMRNKSPLRPTS